MLPYKISYPTGGFDKIFHEIAELLPKSRFLLLTDEHIANIYPKMIEEASQILKGRMEKLVLESGEFSKSRKNKERIEDYMFEKGFERKDAIICLGGGVITDMGGFVAATYMRGIKFVQVPTTLLSMVDASVGSKTAVNSDAGKNLIGSIYDPALIVICVDFLKTIDDRNFSNGMAEIIKIALILDIELFEFLKDKSVAYFRDPKNIKDLVHIVKRAVDLKSQIVIQDRCEADLRKLLNFGHTIGHAIEFSLHEELLHGECVSIGIVLEMELAILAKKFPSDKLTVIKEVLQNYGLPIAKPPKVSVEKLMKYMQSDKKNQFSEIHFVLIEDLGKAYQKTFAFDAQLIKRVTASSLLVKESRLSLPKAAEVISTLPGSKSITNRILLMCSLGVGKVKIRGYLEAEDTHIMLSALKSLNACDILEKTPEYILLNGHGGKLSPSTTELYMANSGTSARFLTTALLMCHGKNVLTGSSRMKERPILDLLESISNQKGVQIEFLEKKGHFPFAVHSQGFQGGKLELNSKVSSQFVTSVLLSAPYAVEPVTLILKDVKESDEIVSAPYIQMTVDLMKKFGIVVKRPQPNIFEIPQGVYKNPEEFYIEPDASTASYDMGFIALNGGVVRVKNLTDDSVQGDSRFATQLEKLGLKASYEKDGIVLTRDLDVPLKAVDVNLKDQTDCFMTLAVILSQVEGISYIRGIENQRVKECNRIRATRKNLIKCGIFCKEIEDGLEIHGKRLERKSRLPANVNRVVVKTYNDHRLAMSFTLLGTYFANMNHNYQIVIEQKDCVTKTFPGFWEHMENIYGVKFEGYDDWRVERPAKHPLGNSAVLIGMRFAGKTNLTHIAQQKLNCLTIEADELLLAEFRKKDASLTSLQQAIEKYGWDTFRDVEAKHLEDNTYSFFDSKKKYIFSTGGGVIERESNRRLLESYQNLIFINRNRDDLIATDQREGAKHPNYSGASYEATLTRRYPIYASLARYVFTYPKYFKDSNLPALINESEYWTRVGDSFKKFIQKVWSPERPPLATDPSFFLAIDLEKLLDINLLQARYLETYEAIELRLDFFIERRKDLPYAEILELLREAISFVHLLVKAPLIMTIRTKAEGGVFTGDRKLYNKFYKDLSKDLVFTYYDIEYSEQNLQFIEYFVSKVKGIAYVTLSKHYFDYKNDKEVLKELDAMTSVTAVDIYKIVLNEQNDINILDQLHIKKPLIKFKLGAKGKESRVKCQFFCPVYDELFDKPVAPGQLTRDEILKLRSQILCEPKFKEFYLIGENVLLSPSPIMHNAGFSALGLLNHTYLRFNDKNVDNIKRLLDSEGFKGASVTMPSKKDVVPFMSEIYGVAKEIGVVNTIVKTDDKLYGYNTDWYGLLKPIQKVMKKKGVCLSDKYALILGAGATAETTIYTLKMYGFIPIVYNRTYERAVALKARYPGLIVCKELKELDDLIEDIALIVSTTPGSADLQVPDRFFEHHPICFDVSIIPKQTAFLSRAMKNGCKDLIYGIEMLLYQGYMQQDIFTGKRCVRKAFKAAALNYYETVLKSLSK